MKALPKIFVSALMFLQSAQMAASSSSSSAPGSEFAYQREIFTPHQTSDITTDSPSLEDLRNDAQNRLMHLNALYGYVNTNKLNGKTQALFKEVTDYENEFRVEVLLKDILADKRYSRDPSKVTTTLDPRLIILSKLKTDYAVERDLASYFLTCLSRFCDAPASQAQLQQLYEQSVFVVRLNMQSLADNLFDHMMVKYPENFYKMGVSKAIDKTNLSVSGEEDSLYLSYLKTYTDSNFMREDTVQFTKRVRFLLTDVVFTNPRVIFELNSLLFYLNIERALLAACPDLEFIPEAYPLEERVRGHEAHRFILSKLINTHETGFLPTVLSQTKIDPKRQAPYLEAKTQARLLPSILNTRAEPEVNAFLAKMFPAQKQVSSSSSSSSSHPPKSQKSKGKVKRPPARVAPPVKQSALPVSQEIDPIPAFFSDLQEAVIPVESPEALATTSEESSEEEVLESEEEKTPVLSSSSSSSSSSSTPAPVRARRAPRPPKAPYVVRHSYDDYVFMRSITRRRTPSYIFHGQEYGFRVRPFDLDNLREIKELTHHAADRLPNVASYTLRFHVREGGEESFLEFSNPDLYLSGGHYFDSERGRVSYGVQNAYHTVLTSDQQMHFRNTAQKGRGLYLGKILEKELREHVVGGAWKDNCADSEAILLLDLTKKMPKYLASLARGASQDMELMAVALGITTYREVCWRCRNLIQGWQWGLQDLIAHERPSLKIAPDFATVVMGFGETLPDSHARELNPPRFFPETISMDIGRSHKFATVSMTRR